MKAAALLLAAAACLAPPLHAVNVMTTADGDGVSCCGFGTPTSIFTRHTATYNQVEVGRAGSLVAVDFSRALHCATSGAPLHTELHTIHLDGNFILLNHSDTAICPFGLRAFSILVVPQWFQFPEETHLSASLCAQPCLGLICGPEGRLPTSTSTGAHTVPDTLQLWPPPLSRALVASSLPLPEPERSPKSPAAFTLPEP